MSGNDNTTQASAPPAYGTIAHHPDQQVFHQFVQRNELSPVVANQLLTVLTQRTIVLLCDDSSSMVSPIIEESNDPFAATTMTRWLLLKKIAFSIIDFITSVNHEGMDIYFLNRDTVRNVTSTSGLQNVFSTVPSGGTPMIGALQRIYREKPISGLLIVVITDGEASDGSRNDLRNVLLSKPYDTHISFAEATDQEDDMEYLDRLKGTIPLFDNTDVYRLERQRVLNIQGLNFKFDWNDYILKILLATFIANYWNVDQRRVPNTNNPNNNYNSNYNTNYNNNNKQVYFPTVSAQPIQQQQRIMQPQYNTQLPLPQQQQQQLQQQQGQYASSVVLSPVSSPNPQVYNNVVVHYPTNYPPRPQPQAACCAIM